MFLQKLFWQLIRYMCGFIGILGKTNVQERIVEGLPLLECRGYDSASIAVVSDAKMSSSTADEKFRENCEWYLN